MSLEWTIEAIEKGFMTEMMTRNMNGQVSGKGVGRRGVLSDAAAIELLRMRISTSGFDTQLVIIYISRGLFDLAHMHWCLERRGGGEGVK